MSGDKLKRVKSVKYWLNKAEASYENKKNMSAEINLIMAQAEMQRLKEKYPVLVLRKWGIRFGTLFVACCIFISINYMTDNKGQTNKGMSYPTKVTVNVSSEKEQLMIPVSQDKVIRHREAAVSLEYEEPVKMIVYQERVKEIPMTNKEKTVEPVISSVELQSVVGEAQRVLRGQS